MRRRMANPSGSARWPSSNAMSTTDAVAAAQRAARRWARCCRRSAASSAAACCCAPAATRAGGGARDRRVARRAAAATPAGQVTARRHGAGLLSAVVRRVAPAAAPPATGCRPPPPGPCRCRRTLVISSGPSTASSPTCSCDTTATCSPRRTPLRRSRAAEGAGAARGGRLCWSRSRTLIAFAAGRAELGGHARDARARRLRRRRGDAACASGASEGSIRNYCVPCVAPPHHHDRRLHTRATTATTDATMSVLDLHFRQQVEEPSRTLHSRRSCPAGRAGSELSRWQSAQPRLATSWSIWARHGWGARPAALRRPPDRPRPRKASCARRAEEGAFDALEQMTPLRTATQIRPTSSSRPTSWSTCAPRTWCARRAPAPAGFAFDRECHAGRDGGLSLAGAGWIERPSERIAHAPEYLEWAVKRADCGVRASATAWCDATARPARSTARSFIARKPTDAEAVAAMKEAATAAPAGSGSRPTRRTRRARCCTRSSRRCSCPTCSMPHFGRGARRGLHCSPPGGAASSAAAADARVSWRAGHRGRRSADQRPARWRPPSTPAGLRLPPALVRRPAGLVPQLVTRRRRWRRSSSTPSASCGAHRGRRRRRAGALGAILESPSDCADS